MIGKKTLSDFFNISPTPSLLLHIDCPKYTIVDVNEAYLEVTQTKREDLIGKGIFEAFPDNDSDPTADGVKNLSQSLHTVVQTNKRHKMAIQKYDIPIRGTSKFELKYWEPENIPLFSDTSELEYIIHCVLDVTEKVKAEKQLKEFGDKIPAEKKATIESALTDLKAAHAAKELGKIETALAAINAAWSAASEDMYKATQGQPEGGAGAAGNNNTQQNAGQSNSTENVTDVDFEEVK